MTWFEDVGITYMEDFRKAQKARDKQSKSVWDGKEFQPRLMLPLSLSYDHRAVNGADAARFTTVLSQLLGDIRTLLL